MHKAGRGKAVQLVYWVRRTGCSAVVMLAAFLFSPAVQAQGCGPTRLKVSQTVSTDLPPAKLWAVVGDFQSTSWDRNAIASTGTGGNQADKAVRTLKLRSGGVLLESLYKYDVEAMSYSYHIDRIDWDDLPVQNVSATLEVLPGENGGSKLVWRAAFYRLLKAGEPAPDIADAQAAQAMTAYLHSSLDGLKSKLEPKT